MTLHAPTPATFLVMGLLSSERSECCGLILPTHIREHHRPPDQDQLTPTGPHPRPFIMFSKVAAVAAVAASAVASTVSEPKLSAPWVESVSEVARSEMMEVTVTMPSTNIAELEKIVEEVSTPGSATYGQVSRRPYIYIYVYPLSDSVVFSTILFRIQPRSVAVTSMAC